MKQSITKEQWAEFDKIGISRNLVVEGRDGLIWYKSAGVPICLSVKELRMVREFNDNLKSN